MFGSSKKNKANMKELLADSLTEEGDTAYALINRNDLSVAYATPSFSELFGIELERFKSDIFILRSFMADDDARAFTQQLEDWDQKERLGFNISFPESRFHTAQTVRFVFMVVQQGAYILAAARNVDRLMEFEAERNKVIQELESKAVGKEEFLSKMSHEIRTPLNGISGLLELIQSNYERNQDITSGVNHARQLTGYMLSLVNDILDMSRIESGRVELESERVDLKSLACEWQNMFAGLAKENGINYHVELVDCTVRYVMGDRMRLSQVVVNFISNALKFTKAGGYVDVVIRQASVIDGMGRFVFRVSDTGKGIEPEFLSRIFRPFEQENTSIARTYGGSGLGMALADSLVTLMGGEIKVESEVGKGSVFTFVLAMPVAEGSQDMDAPVEVPTLHAEQKAPDIDLSGTTMLLAEDNDVNALIAERMLAQHGITIKRVNDGFRVQEDFEKSAPGQYSAILMDIRMPGCDGWEAARAIRGMDHPDATTIPIVALSANAYIEDMRRSASAGMNGHIAKPIDYDELLIVLQSVLSSPTE